MHFSASLYLLSVFALPLPILASPTPSPTLIERTNTTSTCRRGIYNSLALCTKYCGSSTSAGNCSRITTELIHDARPYDCTCPGDSTPDVIEVPTSPSPLSSPASSHSSSASEPQQTPKLKARTLVDDLTVSILRVKSKTKALRQQHGEDLLTNKAPRPPTGLFALPQQMPRCKPGYYPTMDRCMASCGMRSGRCVDVGDGGLGVVACMCKQGEL